MLSFMTSLHLVKQRINILYILTSRSHIAALKKQAHECNCAKVVTTIPLFLTLFNFVVPNFGTISNYLCPEKKKIVSPLYFF